MSTIFLVHNMLKMVKKANFVKNRIIIALFIAWKCVTKCVKVSPIEFLPRINTFLVLYILKLAEIAKSYLKLCKNVWIGVWKYQQYNSDYEYNLFGTQCVENSKKKPNIVKNCVKIAFWLQECVWLSI